ncbi:hypothetical protein C900_01126 [Fulvivirga imtechensis AK7]|uniref:Uncharacterized protein n=2 Tax=Fulvivirga TaxID=396811 RepID=L8JZX6_9BACT|nr:hypothetical protein C900_01126 [Fulvivirga imtechensis AK7]
MKKRGARIIYSKESNSYLYEKEVVFVITFIKPEVKTLIDKFKENE